MCPPPLVSNGQPCQENKIKKLITVFNKISKDEKFSQRLFSIWKNDSFSQSLDSELLAQAEEEVAVLLKYLDGFSEFPTTSLQSYTRPREPIRVYIDGVFDLVHSGHFNACRQAKALGDILVVGVNSDEDVARVKGGVPIYNQEERAEILRGCKWVDEVVVGTPYVVTLDLLDKLNCHFAAHGDDFVTSADGKDCYAEPRSANRLKIFKRTEGISTTTLVSRLLLATKNLENPVAVASPKSVYRYIEESLCSSSASRQSLMSTKRLMEFIGTSRQQPRPGDKIVYVDGSFDVLHVGHLSILQKAKELGDYLIVGIHDDATVYHVKGVGYPVMNLLERALNVLAIRGVDEVIIGAPWIITDYLIKAFYIDIVARGTRIDAKETNTKYENPEISTLNDPYAIPKRLGIYHEVESFSTLTTQVIIERIVDNRNTLISSIQGRTNKEEKHWSELEQSQKLLVREI